jgi:hypothetical protein
MGDALSVTKLHSASRPVVFFQTARRYACGMDEKAEKRVAAQLAKAMAMVCVRNTRLEDLHAGRAAITAVGDYSDIHVVDADGQRIPWSEVSRIDDAEMRALMREIVDRLYTFLIRIDDQAFRAEVERWTLTAQEWDDPRTDAFLAAVPGDQTGPREQSTRQRDEAP